MTDNDAWKMSKRPTPSMLESPDYDRRRDDPQLANEVMDMIHATDHQAVATNAVTAAESDDIERQERQFMAALGAGVQSQLAGQGFERVNVKRIRGSAADGGDSGYIVEMRDRAGRPYEAALSFDEGVAIGAERGETMGRGCVDLVCRKLLDARLNYFARMQ